MPQIVTSTGRRPARCDVVARGTALPGPCSRRLESLAGLLGLGLASAASRRQAASVLFGRWRGTCHCGRGGGVTAGITEVVIATKLFRPNPRHHTVERTRLHDLLRQGRMLPLTLVVAPAGWGKSTLVADWLARERAAAGWCRWTAAMTTPSVSGAISSSPLTRPARRPARPPCGGWTRPAPRSCVT